MSLQIIPMLNCCNEEKFREDITLSLGHPFSKWAIFSGKQTLRNVSFSENFEYVLNGGPRSGVKKIIEVADAAVELLHTKKFKVLFPNKIFT